MFTIRPNNESIDSSTNHAVLAFDDEFAAVKPITNEYYQQQMALMMTPIISDTAIDHA